MALVSTPWNVGNKARATDTPKIDKATKFNHKVLQKKNVLKLVLSLPSEFYLLF